MGGTTIGTGATVAQSTWRSLLTHEAESQTLAMGFVGSENDACIQLIEDLTKERGDSVQIRFSPTDDTHDGFGEGETVRGREGSLTFYTDNLSIGWLAYAYATDAPMSQQRVNFDIQKATFYKLRQWWSRRWDTAVWNQLAGNTVVNSITGYKRSGANIVTAPDADHHIFATGAADETVGADTTAIMTLDLIDECVLKSMILKDSSSFNISPASDGYYHLVVHPYQWKQLRQNTSTGQWEQIREAAIQGGADLESSPFMQGWLGTWNQTKIHVSTYIPNGVHSGTGAAEGTVRRAVFMGANAGVMAFGEDFAGGDHLSWIEQVDGYTNYGILAGSVFGVKRLIQNSDSVGSLVLSTYATS